MWSRIILVRVGVRVRVRVKHILVVTSYQFQIEMWQFSPIMLHGKVSYNFVMLVMVHMRKKSLVTVFPATSCMLITCINLINGVNKCVALIKETNNFIRLTRDIIFF